MTRSVLRPTWPAMALPAQWLGAAGMLPQLTLAVLVLLGPAQYVSAAIMLSLSYAALILSFVGGAWWGLASRQDRNVPPWIWVAAVVPSLIAVAALGAPALAHPPRTSLLIIAASLVATLAIDKRLAAIGLAPKGWLRLRAPLSIGLGSLSFLIASQA